MVVSYLYRLSYQYKPQQKLKKKIASHFFENRFEVMAHKILLTVHNEIESGFASVHMPGGMCL